MTNFFTFLANLFRPAKYPADSDTEPAHITQSRVLLIVYDPVVDISTGMTLSQKMKWYRPTELVNGFMGDLLQVSDGMARYQIAQRVDVDEFPVKKDGFRYTPQTYLDVMQGNAAPHTPPEVDYYAILNKHNVLQSVARNEIDEVWIFAFPHAGFYESTMGGPGAFWCNAPCVEKYRSQQTPFCGDGFFVRTIYRRNAGGLRPSRRVHHG